MIILHGGMKDGWMLLWAERSPDEMRPDGNRDPAGNEHPYCADAEELVNVLASAAPGFRADTGEGVSATAWLPSRGGSPLPSSALVTDPPRSRAKPKLMPLFIGADAERLARLSQHMPAAARALADPDADEPPDQPAAAVLRTFVVAVADSLVRNAMGVPEAAAPKGRRKKLSFDSMHDAWLNGLQSADRAIHGTPEQLGQLRSQVAECQRPIALTASAPFRVCFRLEEPPEPNPRLLRRSGTGGICATCCNPTRTGACCCPPARFGKPAASGSQGWNKTVSTPGSSCWRLWVRPVGSVPVSPTACSGPPAPSSCGDSRPTGQSSATYPRKAGPARGREPATLIDGNSENPVNAGHLRRRGQGYF